MGQPTHRHIHNTIYNWLVEFLQGHSHCTKYGHEISTCKEITASIVQGSAIGPASYVVTASDLTTTSAGNHLCKYADDTYLIIPARNLHSRLVELDHIEAWAGRNNLYLNRAKCVELIISDPKRRRQFNPPPCIMDIKRVTNLTILGVTITKKLSVSEHVRTVINSCAQIMHAIRILRSHGMNDAQLQVVYHSVVIAKLTYASSSWWWFTTASDRQRLEGFLRCGCRQNLYPADKPSITHLIEEADEKLFDNIRYNPSHPLHHLLPRQTDYSYNLRSRSHNLELSQY